MTLEAYQEVDAKAVNLVIRELHINAGNMPDA